MVHYGTNAYRNRHILVSGPSALLSPLYFRGEIVPKVYANKAQTWIQLIMAPYLVFFHHFFQPISYFRWPFSNSWKKEFEKKGFSLSVNEAKSSLDLSTEDTPPKKKISRNRIWALTVKKWCKKNVIFTAIEWVDSMKLMDRINKSAISQNPCLWRDHIISCGHTLHQRLLPFIEKDGILLWKELIRRVFLSWRIKKVDTL